MTGNRRHGVTDLLSAGDVDGLANEIGALLADRSRASSLARAGREHVEAHHTWEHNARVVAELAGELPHRESAGVLG